MFAKPQTGAQTQQSNPSRANLTIPNLGIGNQYLQQLMQRYMMPSPSYQNAQPQQGLLQSNPYQGKQYKYAGSKQAATPAAPSAGGAAGGAAGGCPAGTVLTYDGGGGYYCGPAGQG